MKKFQLAGFANYEVRDDSSVLDLTTGKVAEQKKGIVALTATEDVGEDIKAGQTYNFNVKKQLLPLGEGNWEAVTEDLDRDFSMNEEGDQTPAATAPEAPAADPAAEHKEAVKKAKANVKTAQETLLKTTDPAEFMANREKFEAAKKALEDLEGKEPGFVATPEEQVLIDAFNAQKDAIAKLKAEVDAQELKLAEMKAGLPKGYNAGGSASKGKKNSYEDAQEIRKAYSVGRFGNAGKAETVKDISDRFGISSSSVNYIVNYQQHKLHRGDTAWTPLVNEYYPAIGQPGNITGTNGAPYYEDKISETTERYVVAKNRQPKAGAQNPQTPNAEGAPAAEQPAA